MKAAFRVCRALALVVLPCLPAHESAAQQLPIQGCRNAVPCMDAEGHRGFGDQFLKQGLGNNFFSVETSFGRNLDLRLVKGSKEKVTPDAMGAVDAAAKMFVAAHPVFARFSLVPPLDEPLTPVDMPPHSPKAP